MSERGLDAMERRIQAICAPLPIITSDTREQNPFDLPGAEPGGLATGDYSLRGFDGLDGLPQCLAIERKQFGEVKGMFCAQENRARFREEYSRMERINMRGYAAVVVEGGAGGIVTAEPDSWPSIIASAVSWSMRYGVHWWWAGSRPVARLIAAEILHQFYRLYGPDKGVWHEKTSGEV